tara:strand:+ start:2595 stop:3425 length:831 start_codon:yes stop_codon:yes gene_type:complete
MVNIIHNIMITTNFFAPLEDIQKSQNKFHLSQLTSEYNEGDSITTSTAINCIKLALSLKAGDKIRINGTSLTIFADAAVDAVSFFVEAVTLDEALDLNANIAIDEDNMFVQYQRKTEGTIGGMPVTDDSLGPITFDEYGIYNITGVDPTYVKVLPRDFMINEDGGYEALEFKDATNTGLQVGNADQEMIATVNIPYGTTATEVYVWGSVTTKVVEAYVGNVNANGIGSAIGTGTTDGVRITLTPTASTSTNYLLIIVKVTATSNRIYGGQVTLTQN